MTNVGALPKSTLRIRYLALSMSVIIAPVRRGGIGEAHRNQRRPPRLFVRESPGTWAPLEELIHMFSDCSSVHLSMLAQLESAN